MVMSQRRQLWRGHHNPRIRLVKRGDRNLYILDEPTTGLHLADLQRPLDSLNRLVGAGHTAPVIEHHLAAIKNADWVIDLGPEGGARGGQLVGHCHVHVPSRIWFKLILGCGRMPAAASR